MGDVAITYKVMPDGIEVELEGLKGQIKAIAEKFGQVSDIIESPVAFGLKALMVTIVMPDKEAQPDLLEQELGDIEGIQSVNTENLTLI